MTSRLTQRDRLKRAKMVARYNARTKAPTPRSGDDGPRAAAEPSAEEVDDGRDDAENRDASNTPRSRGRPGRTKAVAKEERHEAPAAAPAASRLTPPPPPSPSGQLAPHSPSPRGTTARQRALALAETKKKLAASRAASARSPSPAARGGRLDESPRAAHNVTFGKTPLAPKGMRKAQAAPPPSSSARAKILERVEGSSSGAGRRPTAVKSQRERFMRMKAAAEHRAAGSGGSAGAASQVPPPPPSPGRGNERKKPEPPEPQSSDGPPPSPPTDVRPPPAPSSTPVPPSPAAASIPDISPATSYRTQRELYLRMRAMEEAELDPQDEDPDAADGGGPVPHPTSAESFDESTFLGVVSVSQSEEEAADDPPPTEEVTISVSEETEEADEEAAPPVASEGAEEETDDPMVVSGAVEVAGVVAPSEGVDSPQGDSHPDLGDVAGGEELAAPSPSNAPREETHRGGSSDVQGDRPTRHSDAFGKFDGFDDAWPDDNFSSASWSASPKSGDKWDDPFNSIRDDDKKDEPAMTAVTVQKDDDGWPQPSSGPWEGEANDAPPNTTMGTFQPGEDDEKENIVWNAEVGFSSPPGHSGREDKALQIEEEARTREGTGGDEPCPKDLEVQTPSSSASFEWDGIGDDAAEGKRRRNDEGQMPTDEAGEVNSAHGSAQYEGFGSVLSSDRRSCNDGDSSDDDIDNLLDDDINSKASEGTTGSATEFDPLSMFGECEEVSPEIEDAFPSDNTAGDIASAADHTNSGTASSAFSTSWMKQPDDSKTSISFPSLHSGSQIKYSIEPPPGTPAAKAPTIPMDSPAGTESLESWWQSRYASTQNSDINSAVQEALTKQMASPPGQRPAVGGAAKDPTNGVCGPSSASRPDKDPHRASKSVAMDEDDSIFSGLDDNSSVLSNMSRQRTKPALTKHNSIATRLTVRASNSKEANVISTKESDEDLFSGMSVASRQLSGSKLSSSQFPRLKESNAMKSLLDGASTAESPSVQQPLPPPPRSASQPEKRKQTAPRQEEASSSTKLFLPDRGYGVINLQKIEHSPTANSVTSDITSSVIFGGDRDFNKRTSSLRNNHNRPLDILETTDEATDQQELSPPSQTANPPAAAVPAQMHDIVSPLADDKKDRKQNQAATSLTENHEVGVSRGVSLMSLSSNGSGTHTKDNIHDKIATKMGSGKFQEDNDTATNSAASQSEEGNTISETVNRVKASLLSRFACGVFDTSSFAFCAANGENGMVEEDEVGQLPNEELPGPVESTGDGTAESNSDSDSGSEDGSQQTNEDDESNSNSDEGSASSDDAENTGLGKKESSRFYPRKESGSTSGTGESTMPDEKTVFIEDGSLSDQERETGIDEENEPSSSAESEPDTKEEILDAQSKAYEKLLMYAYTALSVPPPFNIVEKGEGATKGLSLYPSVLSPTDTLLPCDAMNKVLAKMSSEGIEVLKLNREKKWQPRFLTITREVLHFNKSDDVRFSGIDSCPKGLLWVKKFDAKHHTVASIDKSGKGGILLNAVQQVSVMKDNHPLSRKQKKGKFKDSITLVLHSNNNGSKREVLFRCMSKDDAFALSAGIQAIIDRITVSKPKPLSIETKYPVAAAKPFSPKALASPVAEDRWEV